MTGYKMFIGSSSKETKATEVAYYLQTALDGFCDATVWEDAFTPGLENMNNLIEIAKEQDFAAFILTPDDDMIRGGKRGKAIRDNILIEIGLFAGILGMQRTFLIHCKEDQDKIKAHIPTDIVAVHRVTYARRDNLADAMRTAATKLRQPIRTIRKLGKRPKLRPTEAVYNIVSDMITRCPGKVTLGDIRALYNAEALTIEQMTALSHKL